MKLKSIGIECELDVISRSNWMEANDFEYEATYRNIAICDSEYYDNQVEFKTVPGIGLDKIADFKKFMIDTLLLSKGSKPFSNSPSFVGTHVHMFLANDDGTPVKEPTAFGKTFVVAALYAEILAFFRDWYSVLPVDARDKVLFGGRKSFATRDVILEELKRVLTSNNVSKFFDHRYMNGTLRGQLYDAMTQYAYRDIGNERPKYQPVIWSLARENGKPLSIEARLFPNAYFFMKKPEDIAAFIERFVNVVSVSSKFDMNYNVLTRRISQNDVRYLHRALLKIYTSIKDEASSKTEVLKYVNAALSLHSQCDELMAEVTKPSDIPTCLTVNGIDFSFGPVGGEVKGIDDDSIPVRTDDDSEGDSEGNEVDEDADDDDDDSRPIPLRPRIVNTEVPHVTEVSGDDFTNTISASYDSLFSGSLNRRTNFVEMVEALRQRGVSENQ